MHRMVETPAMEKARRVRPVDEVEWTGEADGVAGDDGQDREDDNEDETDEERLSDMMKMGTVPIVSIVRLE